MPRLNNSTSLVGTGRYLSLLPAGRDLTQGLFYRGSFRGVRARVSARALLDLCFSSAYLGQCDPDEPTGLGLTRCYGIPARVPLHYLKLDHSGLMLYVAINVVRPAKAGDHLASNLTLILVFGPCRHECQIVAAVGLSWHNATRVEHLGWILFF